MSDSMTIAYIVPGSGNAFYCENCLRDCAAVKALRKLGHDVVLVPLYLPLFANEDELHERTPVFFGGVNVYLQQTFAFFRKTPRWFDRLLDSRPVLGLAAARAGSTRADGLGAMTLSMLAGTDGNQAKEVERLVDWLVELKPHVVHFSNALLLGVAPYLKRRLPGVKCVCSLQDEDTWLDALDSPYDKRCDDQVAQLVRQCDALVAVGEAYGQAMRIRWGVSEATCHVIAPGLDSASYAHLAPAVSPRRIGYLSRICEDLGGGRLADAFIALARQPDLADVELLYAGGATDDDKGFIEALRRRFAAAGCADRVRFVAGIALDDRLAMLSQTTVLCVPMAQGEAFGTFIVEALMSGVPVVQPDVVGFGEVVRQTGGGMLYAPDAIGEPAATLGKLLRDQARLRRLGEQGRRKAVELYSDMREASELDRLYRSLLDVV